MDVISIRRDQLGEGMVNQGDTLLEATQKISYPILHECGGFARCTTCRVRILKGEENLSPRTPEEEKMALHRGWDSQIRLACQARVFGPVEVKRELNRRYDLQEVNLQELKGLEKPRSQPVVVLFSDIRNFTGMSEKLEAFDIVYLLNQYYAQIGEAILLNGGHVMNYMGDGIMAVFGLQKNTCHQNALNALRAAWVMQKVVEALSETLGQELGIKIRCGIGLHAGECVLGKIGHPGSHRHTAIGNTVNTASRIESETKAHGVWTFLSEVVLNQVEGLVLPGLKTKARLKGKEQELTLYELPGLANDSLSLLQAIWLRARIYQNPDLLELRDLLVKEFPKEYFPPENLWVPWLEDQADQVFTETFRQVPLQALLQELSARNNPLVLKKGLMTLAKWAKMSEFMPEELEMNP